jgi:hypothetical protein
MVVGGVAITKNFVFRPGEVLKKYQKYCWKGRGGVVLVQGRKKGIFVNTHEMDAAVQVGGFLFLCSGPRRCMERALCLDIINYT